MLCNHFHLPFVLNEHYLLKSSVIMFKSRKTTLYSSAETAETATIFRCVLESQYEGASVSPSVRQSVGPLVRQSVSPLVRQSVSPSVRQSVSPSVRQSVIPSFRRSVSPSVRQSVGPLVRCIVGPSVCQ